jgi:transcriptional regulator with XRE-family HTH domain
MRNPNRVDKHVGSRVRMRRVMLRMSQTKLADALGLSFQQIQKYEYGTNRIGAGRLHQIATILEVPPTFFFEGASPSIGPAVDAYISEFVASKDGLALIDAFRKLPSLKLRRSVVKLVEELGK